MSRKRSGCNERSGEGVLHKTHLRTNGDQNRAYGTPPLIPSYNACGEEESLNLCSGASPWRSRRPAKPRPSPFGPTTALRSGCYQTTSTCSWRMIVANGTLGPCLAMALMRRRSTSLVGRACGLMRGFSTTASRTGTS